MRTHAYFTMVSYQDNVGHECTPKNILDNFKECFGTLRKLTERAKDKTSE